MMRSYVVRTVGGDRAFYNGTDRTNKNPGHIRLSPDSARTFKTAKGAAKMAEKATRSFKNKRVFAAFEADVKITKKLSNKTSW